MGVVFDRHRTSLLVREPSGIDDDTQLRRQPLSMYFPNHPGPLTQGIAETNCLQMLTYVNPCIEMHGASWPEAC